VPIVTPQQIKQKAANAYLAYLRAWVRGNADGFFPRAVPANLTVDARDMAETIRAFDQLERHSKAAIGWGYSVEKHHVESPDGHGPRPKGIWIETADDLLRLAGRGKDFHDIQYVAHRLRSELPGLEGWVVEQVSVIGRHRKVLDELIAVAKHFVANPMPGCFAQQLPVEVNTKFISMHEAVLRTWLNRLLPASAIVSHESKFARRFGLRERQSYHGVLVIDKELQHELRLPFTEFAAPIRSLAELEVRNSTIVVVENKVPLMGVPNVPRALVLTGDGGGAPALAHLPWLHSNRVLYWGDIDAAGFAILSQLRERVPHVESVLMDVRTFELHKQYAKGGPAVKPRQLPALHEPERQLYNRCVSKNLMLEQEKLLQSHVVAEFRSALSGR
jgi:hypothetical protein